MSASQDWSRALRALSALMVDPAGLGGIVVRARAGPVRQRFETLLPRLPLTPTRIHPAIDDQSLFGGLDVASSLTAGRMIRQRGLHDAAAALVVPMAERTPPGLAARLAKMLDNGPGHCLILLDEGAEPDETAPTALADRLAFFADLSTVRHQAAVTKLPAPADLDAARKRLPVVKCDAGHAEKLVILAARFGIDGLRAPLLTLRCARALAALENASIATETHLREATELVYPSRATQYPTQPEDTSDDAPQDTPPNSNDAQTDGLYDLPDDVMIDAVAACLPDDFIAQLAARSRRATAKGSGAGTRRLAHRRGRPLPARPGQLDGRGRIDVIATLRAAAPWQTIRRNAQPGARRTLIHPGDIRLKRFEDRSDRLVIVAVDASGSAALARMAEAKGAVELLLGHAYTKRDQVALVAFRNDNADVLLPPTRALVQAKRKLAALPGGGGTPLASGLRSALDLAHHGQRTGLSPSLVVLTDGRANIALDGTSGRAQAKNDARTLARLIAVNGWPTVVIDTAIRPGPDSETLARWLGATYLRLPHADAKSIHAAADAALSA